MDKFANDKLVKRHAVGRQLLSLDDLSEDLSRVHVPLHELCQVGQVRPHHLLRLLVVEGNQEEKLHCLVVEMLVERAIVVQDLEDVFNNEVYKSDLPNDVLDFDPLKRLLLFKEGAGELP